MTEAQDTASDVANRPRRRKKPIFGVGSWILPCVAWLVAYPIVRAAVATDRARGDWLPGLHELIASFLVSWTNNTIAHFGSREGVLDAVIQSVRKRRESARMSGLPLIEIETGSEAWSEYASKIVEVWKALYTTPPNKPLQPTAEERGG